MPCFNDDWDEDGNKVVLTHEQWNKMNIAAAALCAISGALERVGHLGETLDLIDWRGAGVTKKQFRVWWAEHKQEDEERLEREAAKAEIEKKKHDALSKLTAEERVLLGIK